MISIDDVNKIDEKKWTKRALWIANLFPEEFYFSELNNAIKGGKYNEEKYDRRMELTFESELLRVNNYSIYREQINNKTVEIGVSWYLH